MLFCFYVYYRTLTNRFRGRGQKLLTFCEHQDVSNGLILQIKILYCMYTYCYTFDWFYHKFLSSLLILLYIAKMMSEPWLWCNIWGIISAITISLVDNLWCYFVKHLWEYVIISAGNLIEEKSSVNQISCMMILIPTVCCE